MSLSEAKGTVPEIRHYYPINPHTALQQQSAVHSTSDNPLVAPILPASSQPFRDPPSQNNKNMGSRRIDPDAVYLSSRPLGASSSKTIFRKRHHFGPSREPPPTWLRPQQPHRTPYVEIPNHKSIDLSTYRPISLDSLRLDLLDGEDKSQDFARNFSCSGEGASSPVPLDAAAASAYLDPGSPIHSEQSLSSPGKLITQGKTQAKTKMMFEDKATSCHQCRQKNTKEKMHCRRVGPDGRVCPCFFCRRCIEIRYDDVFNTFHPTWHCPRCRGICNCSLCLRKAGYGFVLDGALSERITGTRGRLSTSGSKKKQARVEEQSTRAWLARMGIALGTEEWINERRRQGVRFVVGKSPPPPNALSPYKEAQFNATLAACTEYFEEEADVMESSGPGPQPDVDASSITPPDIPNPDVERVSSNQGIDSILQPQLPEAQPKIGPIHGTTAAQSLNVGSHLFSSQPLESEDLPGLSAASTRGLKLIIGKPLPGSKRRKRRLATPTVWKQKPTKSKPKKRKKRRVDLTDMDSDDDFELIPEPDMTLPATRVQDGGLLDTGMRTKAIQNDLEEEDRRSVRSSTPISDTDMISAPLPPQEPVLVPTESYAPSKLGATMATDLHAHGGHAFWSSNPDISRGVGHEHGHEPSSLLMMSTPLYSNNDRYSPGDDKSPVGPLVSESVTDFTSRNDTLQFSTASSSLSKPQRMDDYLNLPMRGDESYASTLAAFTTLDETWTTVGTISYSDMANDISPL